MPRVWVEGFDHHNRVTGAREGDAVGSVILAGGEVWDGAGRTPRAGDVVIRDGRIVAVGPRARRQHRDIPVVDLTGCLLLPGLIDVHVHLTMDAEASNRTGLGESDTFAVLRAAHAAEATLRAGFTTVRDMGGRNYAEMDLRDAVGHGLVRGPRMHLAGKIVAMSSPAAEQYAGMYEEADGVEAVVSAVRRQVKRGADVVAFMATGTAFEAGTDPHQVRHSVEELTAGIRAAHSLGRKAAVHAEGIDGLWNGLRAGADTIELGTFLHQDESAARWMADHHVTLVPTMTVFDSFLNAPPDIDLGIDREQAAQLQRDNQESVRLAAGMGVRIACGGNTGMALQPHGGNVRELELLSRRGGLDAEQTLAAATTTAAAALGRADELGRIAVNHLGDLIAVSADAMDDPATLVQPDRVQLVVQAGRPVSGPRRPHS